tara:strand:+ start:780 stop:1133 length:354 start_codon:yes stop_codon:yes gene_type:complete
MMLRLSVNNDETSSDLDLITGESRVALRDVPLSAELAAFAESIAKRDEENALSVIRESLSAASSQEVVVDAAAVAANFQRMVRIADSTGIPLDRPQRTFSEKVWDELNLDRMPRAYN